MHWTVLHTADGAIPSLPEGDGSAQQVFVPDELNLWSLILTFARDQTRLSCEFGANPFSGSRDTWFTNTKWMKKKVTASAKKTLRSSLCAVISNITCSRDTGIMYKKVTLQDINAVSSSTWISNQIKSKRILLLVSNKTVNHKSTQCNITSE